jgi:hypothetical protein
LKLKLNFAKHVNWTIFSLGLLIFCLSIFDGNRHAYSAEIEQSIQFAKGQSSVSINGSVVRGETQKYVVRAKSGQKMSIKISAVEDNAAFQIVEPNKQFLPGAEEADDAKQWIGLLPATGKYVIVVGGIRGNATFSLNVEIDSSDSSMNSTYFGDYEIYNIRKVGGGVTTDSWASAWKNSIVQIQPNSLSIREETINNPYYKIEKNKVIKAEGNVGSRDLSTFYGIGTDRNEIERILVFENRSEKYPYQTIEILDSNNFLDIYDGRIYFFRRKTKN